jgi:hypothetical protein
MDRFSGYVTAKKEMAETLRAVVASGSVTVPQIREQLAAAVRKILDAGVAAGTLRADVRAEDIVVTVVGMFSAISLAGGDEQLQRMLNLLMDAVRARQAQAARRARPVRGLRVRLGQGHPPGHHVPALHPRVLGQQPGQVPRLPVTTCAGFAGPS